MLVTCDSYNPISPGPQPTNLETVEPQDLLNVFGILRPDSLQGWSQSYIHLEFSYPALDIPDSTIVSDAEVKIIRLDGQTKIDSFLFVYSDFNGLMTREYRNQTFFPEVGAYQLICKKSGFPILTGETTLPAIPVIEESSLKQRNNQLIFNILRDNNVGLYEVVLENQNWQIRDRFLKPNTGNVSIVLNLSDECKGEWFLSIYCYDPNLSTYLTANLSIKPNIYQDDFSTVLNGYGCFGSMNIFCRTIWLE